MCNTVVSGYKPKGFRTVSLETRSAGGVQIESQSAFVCSDTCEAMWLMQTTRRRVEELLEGDD
jgi:hypothetical protein